MNRRRLATGAPLALAVILACQPPGADRPHTVLGTNAEQLRDAFNTDSGKVRVVMLVAPT